jgi:hypothetical protein
LPWLHRITVTATQQPPANLRIAHKTRPARTGAAAMAAGLLVLALAPSALAAEAPSAGGAATRDVIIATFFMAVPTSALVLLMFAYRNGRAPWLRRLADRAGEFGNLPYWAALPAGVVGASLLLAVFGLWWDVAYHIKFGRDDGPLANPSHYLIMFGLLGIFCAGVLAMALPEPGERPSPYAVRLTDNWYAPVGGVLIMSSAAFALMGFPLDDLWHRWFGQDVTLWSPTHMVMLCGAVFTLFGEAILLIEGAKTRAMQAETMSKREQRVATVEDKIRRSALCGGLLLGACVYQAEFDYGIPEFQMIFGPMLVAFSAALVLVFARIWVGRFGALAALLLYLPLRTVLVLFAGPVTDTLTSTFPLFIAEALLVELAALIISPRRPVAFAALAGGLIGTVGFAAEFGWSQIFAKYAWPAEILPEAAILALLMALCGAQIGAWMGRMLKLEASKPTGAARWVAPAALGGVVALLVWGFVSDDPRRDVTVTMTNTPAKVDRTGEWVDTTVRLSDPSVAQDAIWLKQIAWQGPGYESADLVVVAPGVYRTREPLPAYGKWKSAIRIHTQEGLLGVPVYEPEDAAIPAPAVPALARVERPLQPDREILQRESTIEPGPTTTAAYTLLFLLLGGLVALQAWGIARVGRGAPPEAPGEPAVAPRAHGSHTAAGTA